MSEHIWPRGQYQSKFWYEKCKCTCEFIFPNQKIEKKKLLTFGIILKLLFSFEMVVIKHPHNVHSMCKDLYDLALICNGPMYVYIMFIYFILVPWF